MEERRGEGKGWEGVKEERRKGKREKVEILDGGGEKKRMRGGRNGRREWRNEGNG